MSNRVFGSVAVALGILVPLAVTLAPKMASAQEFLKDRKYAEGIGVKAGDFELHPGLAGEVGYDSNYLLRSPKTGANIVNGAPQSPVEGTGMLRITPSLYLSTIGQQRRDDNGPAPEPQKLRFRAGLSATYREFVFNPKLTGQRNLSAAADAKVEFLPDRPWGGYLNAGFTRTIQPTVLGDPNLSFNRDDIGFGGALIAQPGGGTLDWQLGYQFHAALFEDDGGKSLNNITHEANTRGRWKFRPRTALLYDATLRFISYSNITESVGGLHGSTPLRARLGLTGLITPRFSILALAGYGASFYNTAASSKVQQFDSVIGQLEGKFYLSGNPGADQPGAVSLTLSSFSLGYLRDFQNSYLGDFYTNDKGYAKLSYFFAGRALLSFEGAVGAIEYPILFNPDGSQRANKFTDIRAEAVLFGEYRFTDTFAINTSLKYTQNFSSTQLPIAAAPGGPVGQVYDMNWQRFEAFIGARWFM